MTLQEIKHRFMAMRNGIIADTLRKAGMNYNVIFGLQLPQLSEIARDCGKDSFLARELWNDRNVRESRLLAPYLFNVDDLAVSDAIAMITDLKTREEADILSFRLLRYHPQLNLIHAEAEKMAAEDKDNSVLQYAVTAIERFM